jgi:adenosylmethionine-8-amino-7-oxononanoate aminotransferase
MSVGERGVFNAPYAPLLLTSSESCSLPCIAKKRRWIPLRHHRKRGDVAALIVEPLVLGAGGMLIYPPSVLSQMKCICEAYDVLFIADEVMTGWGRTGTLFACEQAGVAPDIDATRKD